MYDDEEKIFNINKEDVNVNNDKMNECYAKIIPPRYCKFHSPQGIEIAKNKM